MYLSCFSGNMAYKIWSIGLLFPTQVTGLLMLSPSVPTSIAPKRKNQYQPLHLETIDTDVISYLFRIPFKRNDVAGVSDAGLNQRLFKLFNLTSEFLIGEFPFSDCFLKFLYTVLQFLILFLCSLFSFGISLSFNFLEFLNSFWKRMVRVKDYTSDKNKKNSDDDS